MIVKLLMLIITLLLFIFSPKKIQAQEVNVGCLFPLVGSAGLYGRDSVAAIHIAQEDLKNNEKFSQLNINISIGDTRSNVLRAVQIARDFVNHDDIDFLCGVVSSRIALAVSEIAKEKNIFFIGTDHASPRLIDEALHPYYFRVSNDTRQSMRAGASYIQSHYASGQPISLAFIGPDYDYGYQAWEDLKNFLNEAGIQYEIVGEFWPKLFETDYDIYIEELMATNADIVINGQWGQDFIAFIRQAKGYDFFKQHNLMNFDAGGNYETFAELGDDMPLGLVLSARHHVNWPQTPNNMAFVERFKEQTGRYPSYAAQGAYSGIVSIAEAVIEAGGLEKPENIKHALENLVLKLPEDPEGFSSRMDPHSHQLIQTQAIGISTANTDYPPAKVLLDNWYIYTPTEP